MFKRCPENHIFEINDFAWETVVTSQARQLMCPLCHKIYPFSDFESVQGGAATAVVTQLAPHKQGFSLAGAEEAFVIRAIRLFPKGFFTTEAAHAVWARGMFRKVCQLLISAELTSNFPTPRIWGMLEAGRMKKMWDFNPLTTGAGYDTNREVGEKRFFGAINPKLDIQPGMADAAHRPIYLVLNVNNLLQGGAAGYGHSYVVYKDPVKARSTFLASDSLQLLAGEARQVPMQGQPFLGVTDLATVVTIPDLLVRVTDRKFRFLCAQAGGPPHDYVDEFIEAHGWGELRLDRDVQAIIVSESDLREFLTLAEPPRPSPDVFPAQLNGMNQQQRAAAIEAMLKELRAFCAECKIELQFLPLNLATRTSTGPRPSIAASAVSGAGPPPPPAGPPAGPPGLARFGSGSGETKGSGTGV